MNNDKVENQPTQVKKKKNSSLVQKIIAVVFWILSSVSFLLLIKTELRKWFVFGGEPTSANSVMFWIALGLGILFAYLGKKVWMKK